nr:unnamed protein product [Callosobruchus chinensis]
MSRTVLQTFDTYQKARLQFVQCVADLAVREQNCELLFNAGILELLRPLLTDPCVQIQQCAAVALGKLVHNDAAIADQLLEQNFVPIFLNNLTIGNKYQKKAILFALRSICKHSDRNTLAVINAGGLQAMINCLEDFEVTVKEAAAWGIGYIARHNRALAKACVDAGAVPLLMLCLQEPELNLKQIAASALSDIARHSVELAQNIVDSGVISFLAKNLSNTDERLKKQILCCLSSCAKHSTDLAETVVEAEIFPSVLLHLAHPCNQVRRNAANLVRDVVKHSLELTQLVVNTGGIHALMEVLHQEDGMNDAKLPSITALGFISAHCDQLAMSIVGCKCVVVLGKILNESTDDRLLSVTAWTLGQIGKHSPEHSHAVAAANIFPKLVELYISNESSEDLKHKCKNCLKLCLQKCLLISALEPLLYDAPPNILKYVLGQYSKVLPQDPKARRMFVTSGGLKKVQEMEAKPGSTLFEYINIVNSCFPEEIVRYYSPGYPETLLDKVEQYSPQIMTVLREGQTNEGGMQTEIINMVDEPESSDEEEGNELPIE